MMKLPVILSGPILRRVESSQVFIWLATSKDYSINAELYEMQTQGSKNQPFSIKTKTKTVRLGKHLYIHLIKLMPTRGEFPVNQFLGYNLFFKKGLEEYDLSSLQLLSSDHPESLVYDGFDYPTFFINTNKHSTILYGSCRKPHGKGGDTLAKADDLIKKHGQDLTLRPSSLFMLGDQIYADDIAGPLVPYIQEIKQELIGEGENLIEVEPKLNKAPYQHHLNKINGRQSIAEDLCKFTSSHAENHLLTFGEYAAMYLLNWSPVLWNALIESHGAIAFEDLYKRNSFYPKEKDKLQHQFLEKIEDVHYFQSGISKVRRVLANVPTYMIFDDHDVTDDWNITADWKEQVYGAPLGKHTIASGLTAYWAFQGWGNDPNSFDSSFINDIEQYLKLTSINTPSYHRWINTILDYEGWHFIAPTNPMTLCLDTRTLREYETFQSSDRTLSKPSKLIGSRGWEFLDMLIKESSWQQGDSLQITSATPLYGVDSIESFLKKNIYPFRALGIPVQYKLDFEAWKYNLNGFYSFLDQLIKWKPSECVILSGDVHYAFRAKADLELKGENLSIYQFTSKPDEE
ncbi:hypothetical protein [Metabacillus endolithicus]|uniref:hypothetical protein n=1 Tax=Metabacillus endolithicus TaxID=1535204 RepID=UPI001FF98E9D|nr:hypothetical protein [Metabacillus endolithicus]UPG65764.1 hypothetical protein MVE64_12785 [Metabacillus endolithicus]